MLELAASALDDAVVPCLALIRMPLVAQPRRGKCALLSKRGR